MLVSPQVEENTRRFYAFEIPGRGWQTYPYTVALEPPLQPPTVVQPRAVQQIDDARRHTWLSAFVERLTGSGAPSLPEPEPESEPDEVLPEPVAPPAELAEVRIILPPDAKVASHTTSRWLATLVTCGRLSFELLGSRGEVSVLLAGEPPDAHAALDALESFLPEAHVEELPGFLEERWLESGSLFSGVEFGLAREFMVPLPQTRSFNPDPLTPLIGALGTLQDEELGVVQVLFEKTRAPWAETMLRAVVTSTGEPFFMDAPEITRAAREKAGSPLFAAVVRIAARASSEGAVWEVLRRLAGGLAQFGSPESNELIPLWSDLNQLELDLLQRTTHRSGMLLSADELIGLVHPPSESVKVDALVRNVARTKAVPASLQGDGLLLGENTHRDGTVEVRLPEEARLRHTHVVGASGTGKSTLLVQMILQDIEAGRGVGVLDPHGDLIDDVLARMPPERADVVVLFDPSDDEYVVGWNILGAKSELERELLASDLVAVFRRLSTSWGDQMTSVLSNAVLCFLDSARGGTLLDLRRFLVDESFRREFLPTVRDAHLRSWWELEFPLLVGKKPQGPILTRLDTFLRSKRIRELVTVRRGLDFRQVVDGGQIFLAKLAQGAIGVENAALLGSLLVSKIHQVTLSRQELAAEDRSPFYLYLDEFHEVATPSMATLFSGVRKYRLGLVVAHQDLYQLHGKVPDVERAVLANAYTRICFRLGDDDARALGKGFAYFTPDDLMGLKIGQTICRVGERDADFNLSTEKLEALDSLEAEEQRRAIRELSGRQWGEQREAEQEQQAEPMAEAPREPAAEPEPRPPAPAEPSEERPATPSRQIPKPALDYLALVATDPFLTTRERNEQLDLSAWKGHRVKSELVKLGLGREAAVNPGGRGEQFKLLELTADGRALLAEYGVSVATGHGRGGVAHQWWVRHITTWLEEQGLTPEIEDDSRGARVDLSVPAPDGAIAIEVEMGAGHALENIRKDVDAGYQLVVSLLDSPAAVARLQEESLAEGVHIADLREFAAVLAPLLSLPPLRPPNQNEEPSGTPGRPRRRKAPPLRQPVPPPHDWSDPGALTTPLAAEYLGLSPATLETLRSRGGGPPFVKLGRRVVYRREDLDAWLAERVRKSTSDPGPGG